jgi:glycogen debranching enzyme
MSNTLLKQLEYKEKVGNREFHLYKAGLPHFTRNFTRDSIISAILMEDLFMLQEQLELCSLLQGQKIDSITGEEKGRIFHEYPGVIIRDFNTLFNACDTTCLYLIGWQFLLVKSQNAESLIKKYKNNIQLATDHIISHIKGNKYQEDPAFVNSDKYALKVTYWKDSAISKRQGGQPDYPVVYTLAQCQAINGLRAAASLLNQIEYNEIANNLVSGLHELFDVTRNEFAVLEDSTGKIFVTSDDILHALFYLEVDDLNEDHLKALQDLAKQLTTNLGFRTNSSNFCDLNEGYHSCTLWPFEQALIYIGAKKFKLENIAGICTGILPYLESGPEIFHLVGDTFKAGGCDPQLWTLACRIFFQKELKNSKK